MAAKLILLLALGFLVTDAYRHVNYAIKRNGGIILVDTPEPRVKPDCVYNDCPTTLNTPAPGIAINSQKKQNPQKKDTSDLIFQDFWRTAKNLEVQPVIVVSDLNVEKQLEYAQEEPTLEYS